MQKYLKITWKLLFLKLFVLLQSLFKEQFSNLHIFTSHLIYDGSQFLQHKFIKECIN